MDGAGKKRGPVKAGRCGTFRPKSRHTVAGAVGPTLEGLIVFEQCWAESAP
jgi:hypothetical protein